MCGILACLGARCATESDIEDLRRRVIQLSGRQRHRGPDWGGVCVQKKQESDGSFTVNVLAHERLSIVDPDSGGQPLYDEDGKTALAVNGEIYNHKALRAELKHEHTFKTSSDCEIILHLGKEIGKDVVSKLNGVFAFVMANIDTGLVLVARDAIGVDPLYWGWDKQGAQWFSSEMKCISDVCPRLSQFPPGHLYSNEVESRMFKWYDPSWMDDPIPTGEADLAHIRTVFDQAVKTRLMSDVPYGVLLSGGLDSSLVASVMARHAAMRVEDDEQSPAWYPRLHSFCIAMSPVHEDDPPPPDLANAAKVAKFIGTIHHEYHFTLQEGIDALRDVIYHIETYDLTTVRASTPMYLLARKIRATGCRMVLSGEGSDEMLAGYLYFHKAPNGTELHRETVRKLQALHKYDCLRANKSMAAWSIEVRVPFLDKAFLDAVMTVDPANKMCVATESEPRHGMEKWLLRKAFDDKENPYLPEDVLWRQKEQFSDGVGYGWIDGLRDYADRTVTDEQFATREYRFPVNTPSTKEGYLYRALFEEHFPQAAAIDTVPGGPTVACSSAAAVEWDESFKNNADPSGRAVAGVHMSAYDA